VLQQALDELGGCFPLHFGGELSFAFPPVSFGPR